MDYILEVEAEAEAAEVALNSTASGVQNRANVETWLFFSKITFNYDGKYGTIKILSRDGTS